MRVNGAKGVALLGFAMVAAAFGVAFLSPWALIPPPPQGLIYLNNLIPLEWWGGAWWLAAVVLVWGAFRQDQSRAMVIFAPLLLIWATSYAWTIPTLNNPRLQIAFTLQVVIYLALFMSCLAVARLVNSPPIDLEALRNRVLDGQPQEGNGDEH